MGSGAGVGFPGAGVVAAPSTARASGAGGAGAFASARAGGGSATLAAGAVGPPSPATSRIAPARLEGFRSARPEAGKFVTAPARSAAIAANGAAGLGAAAGFSPPRAAAARC
jgi:hypothetical protein